LTDSSSPEWPTAQAAQAAQAAEVKEVCLAEAIEAFVLLTADDIAGGLVSLRQDCDSATGVTEVIAVPAVTASWSRPGLD
jgi:hypothetical protein